MASGSSKGFDFASDDILCSYEDYSNQEPSNGSHSDSAIATNSSKEFNKSRMARTSVYAPTDDSDNQEVIMLSVERSMKKHTDNIMRFLEGLSSRLSQLELYCYNLDKSIGEMRSDLTRDHGESDARLKFLEKHVQEVHRSVQILRDKQELADTQKELAKLQVAQKESSSSQKDDRSSTPDAHSAESHDQQLAIVPVPPQPQPQSQPPQPQPMTQQQAYYLPPNQPQYQQAQMPPQPQYQQQWAPQVQQQPPAMQPVSSLSRPSSPQVYPQYLPTKPPVNPTPEPLPNSLPMQMTYSNVPPAGSNQPMSYSYGGPVGAPQPQPPPQQQPQQPMKPGFGGQPSEGYGVPPNAYMVYDNGNPSGRVQQHPNQGGGNFYPPNQQQQSGGSGVMSRPPQQQQQSGGGGVMSRPPQQQSMRNHPYNEVIDKLVSMGYRGDHVMGVIQRLDETGQAVDFNAVLDRLNGQRGW